MLSADQNELPPVEVRFENLSFSTSVKKKKQSQAIPSASLQILKTVLFPLAIGAGIAQKIMAGPQPKVAKAAPERLVVLDDVSGVLKPSTLTLVLSPPGHGKSSYLKALAGRSKGIKGTLSYSGVQVLPAVRQSQVHFGQVAQYVSQLDEHVAQLNVEQTFKFIDANARVDNGQKNVDDTLELLKLTNVRKTLVGNHLLRGLSGGEKKRVTVGEGIITNARFLALDEISTGLDSSVTFSIVESLKKRAISNGLTVAIALLQPTPEVIALFDDVVLMREGAVLYHGPIAKVADYLKGVGYVVPHAFTLNKSSRTSDEADPVSRHSEELNSSTGTDLADYLVEFLSDPAATAAKYDPSGSVPKDLPVTTEALKTIWKNSPEFKSMMETKSITPNLIESVRRNEFSIRQYSRASAHGLLYHMKELIARQYLILSKNKLYIRSRFVTALFMSFLLGALFYQKHIDEGMVYFGTFINVLMATGMSGMAEMATVSDGKLVAQKHLLNGFYSAAQYIWASAIGHIPVAAIETLVFSSIVYWMSGMNNEVGRFFFFWLQLFVNSIVFRNMFTVFIFLFSTLQAAQAVPMILMTIIIALTGFILTTDHMGPFKFAVYVNPQSYSFRAIAQNEFFGERFSIIPPGSNMTLGETYLSTFGISTDRVWKWASIYYHFAYAAFLICLTSFIFSKVRVDKSIGSSRVKSAAISDSKDPGTAIVVVPEGTEVGVPVKPSSAVTTSISLPFEPATVTFHSVTYDVNVKTESGAVETKRLLRGVSGVALPGRMVALMGASGAGKTTLLDVLGGRKTEGRMTGEIRLNGLLKQAKNYDPEYLKAHPELSNYGVSLTTFNRISAYVEQLDIHVPTSTVREAIEFAAELRLPSDSVTAAQRKAFVNEVLELLELIPLENRLIGTQSSENSLAPGERKRLTIGVELVSNAPVIFLDEPTSGLDARAAAVVMRVIRNIARAGRTIICTIHQPSSELFYMFDDVLLMQRGGYQAYFGPIGESGKDVVGFLESIPGVPKKPEDMNPASWMLDVLAGTDSSSSRASKKTIADKDDLVKTTFEHENPLRVSLEGESVTSHLKSTGFTEQLERSTRAIADEAARTAKPLVFTSRYPRSIFAQIYFVFRRQLVSHNRNMGLSMGRFGSLLVTSLIYGIIFLDVRKDAFNVSGVQSSVGAIFMLANMGSMVPLQTVLPSILSLRPIFYREAAASVYHPVAYSLSLLLVEIPWISFILIIIIPIGYFMLGLDLNAGVFFYHYLMSVLCSLVMISMGLMIAGIAPAYELAQSIVSILMPIFNLTGGLFAPRSTMAPGIKWLNTITPMRYVFDGLISNQFYCDDSDGTCPTVSIPSSSGFTIKKTYQHVKDLYDIDYDHRFDMIGYLFIFIAIFNVIAFFAARYVRHIKR